MYQATALLSAVHASANPQPVEFRRALDLAIEFLIDIADQLDGDCDLEDSADREDERTGHRLTYGDNQCHGPTNSGFSVDFDRMLPQLAAA